MFLGMSSAFEQSWNSIYDSYAMQPALLEFLLLQIVQIAFFWLPSTVLLMIDIIFPAWSNSHKIQSERSQPSKEQIRDCIQHVFINSVISAAATLGFAWTYDFQTTLFTVSRALPSPRLFTLDIIYAMFVREILFYTSHRAFHHPKLYKRFHKQHHTFIAPMAFAAQYAHPLEHFVANVMPIVLPLAIRKVHVVTFATYLAWALLETCCAHSGYDFFTWPILGTMHDLHHEKFNVNYGGMAWLDWVCGTGRWYRITPGTPGTMNRDLKKRS